MAQPAQLSISLIPAALERSKKNHATSFVVRAWLRGVSYCDVRRCTDLHEYGRKRVQCPRAPDGLRETRCYAGQIDGDAGGRKNKADHCATCHANDGSGQTEMAKNMYPPAPDMRKHETQGMTDGELFYVIENGIRLSGMPAWGTGSHEDQESSWKLVRFIRHLPNLPPEEISKMEKLNPKTSDELEEEQQEEQFLKGQPSNPSTSPDEHHH